MRVISTHAVSIATFVVVLCAACPLVRANDSTGDAFSFSGYGTLGVVYSSEENADFTSSPFKPGGAGHSHPVSTDVDSLIAAQVAARFTSRIAAFVQVMADQGADDSYEPHIEWANVRYQMTDDFSIRAGRTVLPIFIVTDSRKIGYSNPWVRPPVEFYSLVPVVGNDGLDASFRFPLRGATNTVQVSLGQSDSQFPFGDGTATAEARDAVAIANTYEHGFSTVRFNYGRTRTTIPELAPLFDAFRQFGPEGVAIADEYDVDRRLTLFWGIGAMYDPGRWFVMSEWGHVDTDSVLGERAAWYVSSGHRFGRFTPYLTYARVDADSNRADPGLNLSTLPPFLAGPAAELNAGLNSILRSKIDQQTYSVGGRWDFMKDAALKLQFDHTELGAGSPGTLVNLQPGFHPGGDFDVFSFTLEFVL